MSSDSLIKWVDYALKKISPAVIARSGEEGERADFFSVHLIFFGTRYVVRERNGLRLVCLEITEDGLAGNKEISIYDAWQASVEIRHYFGLYDIRWSSWGEFALDQMFRWTYLKISWQNFRNRIASIYVRTTKKVTVERMKILKVVYAKQMGSANSVGLFEVLHSVYGDNFYLFPNTDVAADRVSAILDSLTETEELSVINIVEYKVTGKGVAAIELFEEQERKHKEAMAIQRGMFFLTIALMVFAMLQAKVIEFPPLFKIDRWPWQDELKSETGATKQGSTKQGAG